MHKYLRKKFINGKWQYYYYDPKTKREYTNRSTRLISNVADKIGKDEQTKLKDAKINEDFAHYRNTASKASARLYEKLLAEGMDEETAKKKSRPRYYIDGPKYTSKELNQAFKTAKNYANADPYQRAEMAAKEYQRKTAERQLAQADYDKTFLGKYDKVMTKAKSFLSSLFKKKK